MMNKPRLLLVDFFFPDRYSQFRSRNYPFLLGQAESLGIEAHWFCCHRPPGQKSWERYLIRMSGQEIRQLLEEVAAFSPTHVIVAEKLASPLPARLQHLLGTGGRVENLSEVPSSQIVYWPAEWLPRWLGLEFPATWNKQALVDIARPRYRNRVLNLPPDVRPPPVHVIAGPDCTYRKLLSGNVHFRGIELPDNVRHFGCSFCGGPLDLRRGFRMHPVDLALNQCHSASSCRDTGLDKSSFVISGAAVFARLERFFTGILDMGTPPARFFFGCRIDELVRRGDELDRICTRLERAGHSINLFNMGVENFSPVENQRLNKGLSTGMLERGDRLLRRLEDRHPRSFQFSRWGGYGLILFTPWTTVEDLRINMKFLRRFKGIGENGFALSSKLQILEESAIFWLARKDGLLRKSFRGFVRYDSGCIFRHDQREVPWRFRHRQIEHLYRVACRLAPIADFPPRDELLERTRRIAEAARTSGGSALSLFEQALNFVATRKRFTTASEIVEFLEGEVFRVYPPRHPTGPTKEAPAVGVGDPRATLLRQIIEKLQRQGCLADETRLVEVALQPGEPVQLRVEFESNGSNLVFYLLERKSLLPAFLASRRFLLRYDASTPPDRDWKISLAEFLLAHAEAYFHLPGEEEACSRTDDPVVPLAPVQIAKLVTPAPAGHETTAH